MNELMLQPLLAGSCGLLFGAAVGWLMRARKAAQELRIAEGNWSPRLEQAVGQAKASVGQAASLRASLESTQRLMLKTKHEAVSAGTEIESIRERHQITAKELSATRAERDEYAKRAAELQRFVVGAKQQISELNTEFSKSRDFYKAQLGSAIEQRHLLERSVESLRSEQTSLTALLTAAKDDKDSLERMLETARMRLENLETIENKSIALEADNSDLRYKLESANRDAEKLRRDIGEVEDLKAQNRELASGLESMEASCRQYEEDAKRYRDQFQSSEKASESLRMKLGDIEQGMSDLHSAPEMARGITKMPPTLTTVPAEGEGDDLTEIVGVGKVFERMLHDLGIYYFRQIASFGAVELARVNAELKEFKGRIENDDWIGQARDLHHKKYGPTNVASAPVEQRQ